MYLHISSWLFYQLLFLGHHSSEKFCLRKTLIQIISYSYIIIVVHLLTFVSSSLLPPCTAAHQGPLPFTLLEFSQIHVHWVSDANSPSLPSPPSSLFAFNRSQHQGLLQWVDFSQLVARVLELELQHQSFQWIFTVDFL